MAGKLFRIGHLGDLNDLMVLGALAGAEMAMLDVGIEIKLGSGVAAARRISERPSWPKRRHRPKRNVLLRRIPKALSTPRGHCDAVVTLG